MIITVKKFYKTCLASLVLLVCGNYHVYGMNKDYLNRLNQAKQALITLGDALELVLEDNDSEYFYRKNAEAIV